ncbi:tripeptide aminopeptidase [Brevinema andersonii]|uniref:Peptidase T n=1 Tax=Brevinema andersonii TaxID=34097 RepID=A0A1I1DNS5_BREAD|nr:peptidase T [Brevinema andersonii]SFB76504.1 tripeptide aminopeptidase [Brevinema andersonii]
MINYQQKLINYFFEYLQFNTQSNETAKTIPSTSGQMELARYIFKQLRDFGIQDVSLDDQAVLIVRIDGSIPGPTIAFLSHLDTADIGMNPEIQAQKIHFTGNEIILNSEKNIIMSPELFPELLQYLGEDIIFSTGTSILGCDNKAGLAVLTTLGEYLIREKPEHSTVILIYVPDEEIGLLGSQLLDTKKINADFAYTIDGGPLGEFGYETFNAASAEITIQGISIHPGSGKDKLVNPILIANDLINQFDPLNTPEHSEGREGFFWIHDITGNPTQAKIELIIRDFDLKEFENKKQWLRSAIKDISLRYPKAKIDYQITDNYANIANTLPSDRRCIDLAMQAMENLGITVYTEPIRGGTDGSILSANGLITPNLFTGGHNFHSIYEFLPIRSFQQSFETAVEIVKLAKYYTKVENDPNFKTQ